jgi:hypothetical protein
MRKPPYSPERCLRCGAESPCVDWNEVDIGVGVQTFEPQFECPMHGRFAFVERTVEEIAAGVKPRVMYADD